MAEDMETTATVVDEPSTRTLEVINREYSDLCAQFGNFIYNQLTKMEGLNKEATVLLKTKNKEMLPNESDRQ